MTGRRSYTSGIEKALFLLSRGYCYAPRCQTPVLRKINGEPRVNVFIAHIYGREPAAARYDPQAMPPDRVDGFVNLLLLCKPHHDEVDALPTRAKYPSHVLLRWKADRERELAEQLKGLTGLTEEKLQRYMVEAVSNSRAEIMAAVAEVEKVSRETADLLKKLIAETFDRPYVDSDALATLDRAAPFLAQLPEYAPMLHQSARMLADLPDHAPLLLRAADEINQAALRVDGATLDGLADRFHRIQGSANELARASSSLSWLPEAVRDLDELSHGLVRSAAPAGGQQLRRAFTWGIVTGVLIVVAILTLYTFAIK
jgi:hypothetical protein